MNACAALPTRSPVRDRYSTSLAASPTEVAEAQALRFEVFNVELAEGLVTSFITGRDEDPFDAVCRHLLVRETATGRVVGTYRLQTGAQAQAGLGYYSETEFDLAPLKPHRPEILELGRACVHKDHRNLRVLAALWRGIAQVAAGAGLALYRQLAATHIAPLEFRTLPRPLAVCTTARPLPVAPPIPKLLAAYFLLGAWIAGAPALDHEFGTVDFLTILDLQRLNPAAARLYLGSQWQPPSVVSAV
jgi:putative hemolysin